MFIKGQYKGHGIKLFLDSSGDTQTYICNDITQN